jgi:hypothetical protein
MKKHPHHWIVHPMLSRQLCCTCGLLWLRNEVSDRWAKRPCTGKVDQ